MSDHGLTLLIVLIGLTWVVGGWLQWLTLRRQERLIRQLERQSEALHRLRVPIEDDPWMPTDGPVERGQHDDLRADRLVRSSTWKGL